MDKIAFQAGYMEKTSVVDARKEFLDQKTDWGSRGRGSPNSPLIPALMGLSATNLRLAADGLMSEGWIGGRPLSVAALALPTAVGGLVGYKAGKQALKSGFTEEEVGRPGLKRSLAATGGVLGGTLAGSALSNVLSKIKGRNVGDLLPRALGAGLGALSADMLARRSFKKRLINALAKRPEKSADLLNENKSTGDMEKTSILIPSWGGGSIVSNGGLGAELGYTYGLGLVPVPKVGLRVGDESGGVSIAGPIPSIGVDSGMPARKWVSHRPRSFYKQVYDKVREKSPDKFVEAERPKG